MEARNSRRRLPLGHKLFAVILAIAVAFGVYAWLLHNAGQTGGAAVLSFDPAAARSVDPGFADASEPAAAFAQSILSDEEVAGLSKTAHLASSATTVQIGEFRSRLELTQPSGELLQVRFQDADPVRSAATANAVADALSTWTPSRPSAAAPIASPQPAPAAATPAKSPSVAQESRPRSGLADGLGQLQAQLSTTNREVVRLSAPTGRGSSGRRTHGDAERSYSQSRQQQLLKTQVRAALKKLDDLRTRYAKENPEPGVEARLAKIQQALLAILPAGNSSMQSRAASGYRAAGTNAGQLRRERAQLTDAISVVNTQRQAIERAEAAQPAPEEATQTAVPPVSGSAAGSEAQAPSPSQPPAVSGSGEAAAGPPFKNPLRLTRLASQSAGSLLWPVDEHAVVPAVVPAVVAGFLCGFVYLVATARRYRPFEGEEDIPEASASTAHRFITPSEPVRAAMWTSNWSEPAPRESVLPQRASFTFETPPAESVPSESAPQGDGDEHAVAEEEKAVIGTAATVRRYGSAEDEEDIPAASPRSVQGFITPSEPVRAADWAANRTEAAPRESALPQRASFTFETAPAESAPSESAPQGGGDEHAVAEEKAADKAAADKAGVDKAGVMGGEVAGRGEEPVASEQSDGIADPFVAKFRRTLSETSLGKMFEGDAPVEGGSATEPKQDGREAETHSDRWAG